MNLSQFCHLHFGSRLQKLSYVNLISMTVIGLVSSIEYVKTSISYAETVHSMSHPEYIMYVDEEVEEESNICLHTNENRDVLVHSVYFLTSLVIFYSVVELFTGVLLVRLVFISKMTSVASMKTTKIFWASYQLILVLLLVLTYIVFSPLKDQSKSEFYLKLFLFILLVGWKVMIWIIFAFYNRQPELNTRRTQELLGGCSHNLCLVMVQL